MWRCPYVLSYALNQTVHGTKELRSLDQGVATKRSENEGVNAVRNKHSLRDANGKRAARMPVNIRGILGVVANQAQQAQRYQVWLQEGNELKELNRRRSSHFKYLKGQLPHSCDRELVVEWPSSRKKRAPFLSEQRAITGKGDVGLLNIRGGLFKSEGQAAQILRESDSSIRIVSVTRSLPEETSLLRPLAASRVRLPCDTAGHAGFCEVK